MKKLVSVSLAAAMVASMTACGSNNTAETTAAAAAAETTAAAGETSAAAESQTAADGASFKIGVTRTFNWRSSSIRQRSCKRRKVSSR